MVFTLVSYVFKAILRDRFLQAISVSVLLVSALSVFVGSSAIIEKAAFVHVFAAGGLRLVGAIGLILFVAFFIRRSFDTREIEYLLARPVSRFMLLLCYSLSFVALAILMAVVQGLCLAIVGADFGGLGTWVWLVSVAGENIILVQVALFFSMVLRSAVTSVMAVLGFYVLARMMGQILGIIDTKTEGTMMYVLDGIMQGISLFIPRLDLFGQGSWLLYALPEFGVGVFFIICQVIVFVSFIFTASFIDLKNKRF